MKILLRLLPHDRHGKTHVALYVGILALLSIGAMVLLHYLV